MHTFFFAFKYLFIWLHGSYLQHVVSFDAALGRLFLWHVRS